MVPVEMNNNNNNNNNQDDDNNGNNNNMNTSENQEDGSDHQDPRPRKKTRYHRHTQQQIQEMENLFKECPHPDGKQREELSRQLGLDELQIKFWFQNKRTQTKNLQERLENSQLQEENNRLRSENYQCREAIANAICPKCRGHTAIGEMCDEEHQLSLEIARLKEEIRQLSEVTTKLTGKSVMKDTHTSPRIQARPSEPWMESNGSIRNLPWSIIGVKDSDKPLIIELAVGAMDELMVTARVNEPLWNVRANDECLALNLNEYTKIFRNGLGPILNGFRTEASRTTATVYMNHMDIVQRLMDVNLWSTMFAGLVARAMTHETIFTGVQGNFDGAFHLMTAEYQVLSPVVSTRECYFVRYCKQYGEGLWAVVDVSIDHLFPNLELKCRRRPSGCLIQQIQNGFSQVTWVEHVEVDDRGGVHPSHETLVSSGQAFGAERWLATLERQCERLACLMATNVPTIEPDGLTPEAKRSLLKIAERMTRSFYCGVATSTKDVWFDWCGNSGRNTRMMTRKSLNERGSPEGLILYASTSFWVSVPPNTLFDFLRDVNNRTNWDVLSIVGEAVQLLSQIPNGRDIRNCVSLFRNANTCKTNMMMIQESSTDQTASFVIYAPVNVSSIQNVVTAGHDPDYVPLLSSGFAILPDGMAQPGKEGGSLVNVAFQMLVDSVPSAMLKLTSVATMENLILTTAHKIEAYFNHQTA